MNDCYKCGKKGSLAIALPLFVEFEDATKAFDADDAVLAATLQARSTASRSQLKPLPDTVIDVEEDTACPDVDSDADIDDGADKIAERPTSALEEAATVASATVAERYGALLLEMPQWRSELQDLGSKSKAVRLALENQVLKWDEARRRREKFEAMCVQQEEKLEKHRRQHEALLEDIQKMREDDTSLQYYDLLLANKENDALTFLTRSVTFANDPATLITEIARLLEHHRQLGKKWNRDAVAATRKTTEAKRELELRQQSVEDTKRKLRRLASGSGSTTSLVSSQGSSESIASSRSALL